MSVRLRKGEPRAMYFEDALLPRWAHCLDVLPVSVLGDMRGAKFRSLGLWFFRFCVCIGRVRRSPTYAIRKYCGQLLEVIEQHEEEILERIPIRSSISAPPRDVLAEWKRSLELILELSAGKKSCTWYADSHPSDPLWPGTWLYRQKLEARGYVIRDEEEAVDKAIARMDRTIAALREPVVIGKSIRHRKIR